MSKFVFIKTANDDAYMNTVDNFRGAIHSGDTAVDLYFDAAGSGVAGAFDKIPLVVVTEKEQEVMEFIGGALAGTHDVLTADESGKIFVFQDAAAVLTLPDSGAGDIIGTTYTFISNSAGSGQEVICADTTGEKMIGAVLIADSDDATTAGSYTAEAGDGFSSIEFTGATEGELGSFFKLTCYDTDLWFIEGVVLQGGGSATPFAAS